jgi:hypothetical protein
VFLDTTLRKRDSCGRERTAALSFGEARCESRPFSQVGAARAPSPVSSWALTIVGCALTVSVGRGL